MKKFILVTTVICFAGLGACQKEKAKSESSNACPENPRTSVSTNLKGTWMYGQFSMTEYWNQNPADYLGNAFQFAIAFKFNADGSYEQYFTSSTVTAGVRTYQQSVTRGSVVVDEQNRTIRTYACSSRYKRTRNGQTIEERDLTKGEITAVTDYGYTTGEEANGIKALYITLNGTNSPLTFLYK